MHFSIFSRLSRLVVISTIGVILIPGLCLGADFSADMLTKQGSMTVTGKLYVAGNKARQEVKAGGQTQIIIIRGDKGVSYAINPAGKNYREWKGAMKSWSASMMDSMLSMNATKKSMGKQMVNGISCEKYVYTPKAKQQGTITQYVAKQYDLAMKVEIKAPRGTILMEYKNVKAGTQAASLFELPKGYKKMASPMMMPGGKRPAQPGRR